MTLVPESEWSLDLATPKLYCTTKDGKCVQMDYTIPKDAIIVKATPVAGEPRPSFLINSKVNVKYMKPGDAIIVETNGKSLLKGVGFVKGGRGELLEGGLLQGKAKKRGSLIVPFLHIRVLKDFYGNKK